MAVIPGLAGNPDLPQNYIPTTQAAVTGQSTPMRFPSEEPRYFTIIKFVKFQRNNPKTQAVRVDQADIVLPLPINLLEQYTMNYNEVALDKLGGADQAISEFIDRYQTNGGLDADQVGQWGEAFVNLTQALSRRAISFLSNDASGLLDRITGNVVNPHLTTIFHGVGLRSHDFRWKLAPKSAQEAQELARIRDYVRDHMHPTKKNEFLLNFPDEVYVSFHAGDRPFLYPILKSVVVDFALDPSSEGTNAFHVDDQPVIWDMQIRFQEVETATRETWQQSAGDTAAVSPPVGGT